MNKSTLRQTVSGLAVAAAAIGALAATGPAAAETSFKGKTVTMIIGYRPGGGTDAVGRLAGKYLAQYLPGSPQIIFRNMPGGGGITAMNHMANQAKRDGSTITAGSSTQPDPLRFRRKSAKYDPLTFHYIGGIARGSTVMMINPAAKERLYDKSKKPVIMGAVDGTRSSMQVALWGGEYLGWNLKWVIGYPGTSEIALALQRGEVDMSSTGNLFLIKELIEAKKAETLVQSGTLAGGKMVARPEFPKVPIFTALMQGKIKDPVAQKAFAYWEGLNQLDKWLALPPKTPADVVQTYRAAFVKAVKDRDFLAQGRKVISQDFEAVLPDDQTTMIEKIASTPPEALAFIQALKKKNGLPVDKGKKPALLKATANLDEVKRGGRVLIFKAKGKKQWTRVSSSETKVRINGKESRRKNLKAGMTCKLEYVQGKNAKSVDCK
ncbi:MAG: tripartite tricarboxylate transporter substrate-binding protein [Alphaproteobacteria bacterium]|nr:tripartite tricarboxylate transporter substrate-binding protein [Alphaproteobacteria bacterium]